MMTDNEAREIINREIDKACDDELYMTDEVYDALCVASKVLALGVCSQSKWIPVSERLPKENEYIGNVCKYYLIQDEYGDMHVAHLSNVGWIPMDSLKAIGDEVIAWMPLPQEYKVESEGKE